MLEYCLFSVFLLSVWSPATVAGDCDIFSVSDCMSNLTDTYENTTNMVITSSVDLVAICSHYNSVKECVEPFIDDCNDTIRAPWDEMNNTLGSWCSDDMIGMHCNISDFTQCTENITMMYPNITMVGPQLLNETELEEVCSMFPAAQECAYSFVDDCSMVSRVYWDTINRTMTYMCSNYSMEILSNATECLSSEEVKAEVDQCNAPFDMESSALDKEKMCSSITEYRECLMDATDVHCGDLTWHWMNQLLHESLDFAMNLYDCDGSAGCRLNSNLWLMMILTGSLVLKWLN